MIQIKELEKLSDIELKALAYDTIIMMQQVQNDLRILNEILDKRHNTSTIPTSSPKSL